MRQERSMSSAVSQSFVLGNVKLDQVWMLQFKGGSKYWFEFYNVLLNAKLNITRIVTGIKMLKVKVEGCLLSHNSM